MAWVPKGLGVLNNSYDGFTMLQLMNSLARELERMQREIDELKRKVGQPNV